MTFRGLIKLLHQALHLWSDSIVALSCVEKGPSFGGVFVVNRVCEVLPVEAQRCWVSGTCNPADLTTRRTSVSELKENSLWWSGQDWLALEEEHWPHSPTLSDISGVCVLASVSMTTHK